jgi:hypothetical protein
MKKLAIVFSFLFTVNAAIAQDTDAPSRHGSSSIQPTSVTYAFSPIHVTEENIGLGLSAEIFPGNSNIVSIYLPFSIAFSPMEDRDGYGYRSSGSYQTSNPYSLPPLFEQWNIQKEIIYFYPGIKIYPTGAFKKASYAIGANLVTAIGRTQQVSTTYKVNTQMEPNGSILYTHEMVSRQTANLSTFKFGAMLLNTVNIRPTERFYIGLEFGLGYTYINKFASQRLSREALVQFGVKFGFAY